MLDVKFIFILLFHLIVADNNNENIVHTSHGKVSGVLKKTLVKGEEYNGFLGIPFATPPLGDLRFMPPQDIAPWDDILYATKSKPECIQYNTNVLKGQPFGIFGSEDCLYLDIFTPGIDDKKRPVIVLLYNTNFSNSPNRTRDYGPDFLIENDVVIVTISHRLSVFGFLYFEDDTLPGNAGLKDIVTGLEWVKRNAENFGGDSELITLVGAQGGAAAVDLLIHSKAKDLFHSAILQSGSSLAAKYLQVNVRERALALGKLLNLQTSDTEKLLRNLKTVPADELLANVNLAMHNDFTKYNQRSLLVFGPVVENNSDGFITDYPENLHDSVIIPIMIGFNSLEGLELSSELLYQPGYMSFIEKDFIITMPKRVDFTIDPLHQDYEQAIQDIKEFYFASKRIDQNSVAEYVSYIGDVFIAYNVDFTAQVYSSKTSVYYYHFSYYSGLNEIKNSILKLSSVKDGTVGAATGDELCYLFKCPSLRDKYLKYWREKSEEALVQEKLVKLWTNFAKYGNPTPNDDEYFNIKWPMYNSESKQYLDVNEDLNIRQDVYSERFQFWDQFVTNWRRKTGKQYDKQEL